MKKDNHSKRDADPEKRPFEQDKTRKDGETPPLKEPVTGTPWAGPGERQRAVPDKSSRVSAGEESQ